MDLDIDETLNDGVYRSKDITSDLDLGDYRYTYRYFANTLLLIETEL